LRNEIIIYYISPYFQITFPVTKYISSHITRCEHVKSLRSSLMHDIKITLAINALLLSVE